jgi:hypothetical protein
MFVRLVRSDSWMNRVEFDYSREGNSSIGRKR